MSKKRTLGDEYRDFIAGKTDGGYFTGVKRNSGRFFYKDGDKTKLMTSNEINTLRGKVISSTKSTPLTNGLVNQKSNAVNNTKKIANTMVSMLNNPKTLAEKVKADTPPKAVHTVPSQDQYYQRLANAKNITTVPTKEQQIQYKSDVNTLNQIQQYQNKQKFDNIYSGYNYAQLKAELAKTDSKADKDLHSYLKNKADEVATSEDIQKEIEALDKEFGELTPFVEKDDIRRREIEDEWEVLETLKRKKINEESKQKNYTNVIEEDVTVLTALQKYYALQKADETEKMLKATGHDISSVKVQSTIDSYNFAKALSQEEKEKIISDFEKLDNKAELYKYFVREQEEKEATEQNTILQNYAEEHPVLASLARTSLNTYGSVSDAVKYIGAKVDYELGGEGYINPDTTNVAKAQVIHKTVSDNIDNPVGKFLYDNGMSMVDNIARLPITALPGGKALSLAIAGTSSGVSSANNVIERGGSLNDAWFTGGVSAIAEVVFEKIPLDNLIKLKKEGSDSVIKAVAKQMAIEGFEELGTEATNIVADYIINQDLSQVALQYENYIKQGYSEAEARQKVAIEIALQLGESTLGGAFSGGVFSGGALLLNYGGHKLQQRDIEKLKNKETRKQLGEEALANEDFDLNNLIAQGKISGNAKAVKLANSIERTIANSGKDKITAGDVGNLMYLMSLDRPNNNYEVENTEKQEIINDNYTMGGVQKTEAVNATQQIAENKNSEKITDAFGEAHPRGLNVKTRTGGTITVLGIESSAKDFGASDNNVILATNNGGKINADDVTPLLPHFQQLFNYAKNFDTIGAKNFVKEYESYLNSAKKSGKNASVEAYAKAFEDLYSLGKMGVTYDSVKASGAYESAISTLGGGIAYVATQAGNNDTNVTRQFEANKIQKIRVPGENNSINSRMYIEPGSESSVVASDEQLQILQAVAQKVGKDIVLTNKLVDDENGVSKNGMYDGDKIYIRADLNENYMLAVALHEATHDLRANSPLEYQALCNFIMNYLVSKGENVNSLLDNIKDNWKENVSTEDSVLEELVCQTVMAIATDEKAIKTVLNIKENKNILQKVASALKKIAQYTYDFMKGIGFSKHNLQAQAWLEDAKAIQTLAEKLSSALDKNRNVTTTQSTEQQKNNTQKGAKYSIADDIVDDNGHHYGKGVLLDTNIFNKTKPRDWGKKLRDFVYSNLTNKKIVIFDESGNEYSVEFAKANERARKDGANNPHKVIDKLARKNDNISSLAVAHADEIIEVSKYDNFEDEHSHQWLDENGWEYRTAYFVDKKGNIYSSILNIAKTKDGRNILYDINKISNIGHGVVLSNAKSKRSSHIKSNIAKNNVSQKNNNVKSKSSVDDTIRTDTEYMKAVENDDMETAQRLVEEVAKANGYTIRAYHGTARGDRVGTVFLPERATSGPMAFFTSSEEIASNYARDKADTSLAYDEEYTDYHTQFRVQKNGKSISIDDLWNTLSFSEKAKIKERAKHITFDDEAENIIYDAKVEYGVGGFDAYRINSNKGNYLSALIEEWLDDGNLYGEEYRFIDVLKLVGLDNVEYRNPNARHEKVYDTYLKITNPFNTNDVDKAFVQGLEQWYDEQDVDKYDRLSSGADFWDKNNRTIEDVIERLNDDIENRTTHTWTSIPDFLTDYLKSMGYDGIQDLGGKGGGDNHIVYIPFYSSQIKSADPVTYDYNGNVIPLSERFNDNQKDIRYSVDDTILDEFNIPNGKLGDSIFVQRQVYNTLKNDVFFNDIDSESRTVVNKNSNMIVEINKSGIKETFSNKNFSSNSKSLKLLKLATIKRLPEIIENGVLIKDDVQNYHKENSTLKFAYIEHRVVANNNPVKVIVTIRKSLQKNKFWVHHVYIEKDTGSTSVGTSKSSITAYTTSDVNDTVSHDNGIVKPKLSVDDTIIDFNDDWFLDEDLFFEGTEEHINFEKVIKDSPADALNIIYNTASKTAITGISQFKDVQLDYKAYTSIARKVMKDYGIIKKHNPDVEAKIANTIRKYAELIESGNYSDGADVIEKLVLECKGYIALSGDYDKTVLQEEREAILGYLSGKTLLITDYAEDFVRENYGNVAKYRRNMMGKVSVGLERNAKSMQNTMYMDDVISFVEENYPMFITDECDSVQGFQWLDNLLNNVLQPKYVNHYFDGFYENADTAAIEMAFDMTTEVISAKAKQLVTSEKADRKKVRELTKARKIAIAEREAMLKAKAESYKKQFQEERNKRIEQINKMRDNLNNAQNKSKEQKLQLLKKIARLEHLVATQKKTLNLSYESIREQYTEGRTRTIYRERLGRMLDRMVKKLDGKAKNNEYIPESLKGPIIEVLGSFVADPGEYKNGNKKTLPGYFGEWKRIAEVGDRVNELKDAYSKLKSDNVKNPDYAFIDINSLSYQEGTFKILNMLSEQVKNKNIYELNANDLQALYTTMTELDNSLKNAVEIILDGQRIAIKEAAEKGIAETESVKFRKGIDKFNNTALNAVASLPHDLRNSFIATQEDPVRYGRFLSGYHDDYVTAKIFKGLHEGDKNSIKIIQEAFLRVQAVTSKYSNKELKNLQKADIKQFNFKDLKTGKRVKISQGMLIAIALTDRQADGHRHLVNEQYNHYTVIPDLDMMNIGLDGYGDKSHKVRFSEDDIRVIKSYVENNKLLRELSGAVSEVYNTILSQHINEVSMQKYGMLIATVKDYYPLHIYKDGAKYEKNFEAEFMDMRLKSKGFVQYRIFSYAPIMIDDVLKTFVQHVKGTAEYCGLLIPIENFKKVYNSSNGDITLHEAIKEKFGTSAEHYIEKLMADLQRAPDILDNSIIQKAQGNFMGAKLLLNPGSALQQFAVYPTAYNYFDVANVTKASTIGVAKFKKLTETYSKYTPYLWYRKEGNGAVVGELSRELGFTKKCLDIADIMSKLDQVVVGSLLYAAELHVEQTTNLKRGTDAFYKEVARQFEKCIDETQPNNMLTSKPQFIRNNVMRILSLNAYLSQNMAIANTILDSFMEYSARRSDYKENKNDVTKEAKNEAFKKFVGSLIGATASSMLIGAFKILSALFLWHKWEDFQDEEGEVTFKTLSAKFLDYTLESLTGIFAWGDTIYQAVSSLMQGEHFWGLEVMSIENINDLITKVSKGDFVAVAALIADCFGYPVESGLKIFRSLWSYGNDLLNGRGDIISAKNSLGELNTDYFHYIILRAKQNGETEKAEHFEDMWIDYLMNKKGKTKEQATETIKDKLVTALAVSDDDVELAAQAFANGDLDTYETHLNKVISYGFDSKDVKSAVDKVIKNIIAELKDKKITEKEDVIEDLKQQGFNDKGCEHIYNEMQNSTEEESEEVASVFADTSQDKGVAYTYSDAFEALKSGDKDNYNHIKNYLIEEAGKEEKDIQSAMRNASRTDPLWAEYIKAYEDNDGTKMREIKAMLTNVYGSWDTAVEAMHRYQKRMKEKENK